MINNFSGKYKFLSNFFIEPDGTTVEREYQAAKCYLHEDKFRFKRLSPAQAKKLGRQVTIRPDWEQVKLGIMFDLVRQKFSDHTDLRLNLYDTMPVELLEGNVWGDKFWGTVNGVGENHLGKILMKVRDLIAIEG